MTNLSGFSTSFASGNVRVRNPPASTVEEVFERGFLDLSPLYFGESKFAWTGNWDVVTELRVKDVYCIGKRSKLPSSFVTFCAEAMTVT
jgi:hypothetical protein